MPIRCLRLSATILHLAGASCYLSRTLTSFLRLFVQRVRLGAPGLIQKALTICRRVVVAMKHDYDEKILGWRVGLHRALPGTTKRAPAVLTSAL